MSYLRSTLAILAVINSCNALDPERIGASARDLLQKGAKTIEVTKQDMSHTSAFSSRSDMFKIRGEAKSGSRAQGSVPVEVSAASLAKVHDLESVYQSKAMLPVKKNNLGHSGTEAHSPTDNLIIVSGGQVHLSGSKYQNGDRVLLDFDGITGDHVPLPQSTTNAPTDDCLSVDLIFETDDDAASLSIIMFDVSDLVDGVLDDPIIFASEGTLTDNFEYSLRKPLCLDVTKCYQVALFDSAGDGFDTTGSLIVTVDGTDILAVGPGDEGTECPSCVVPTTTFFSAAFGSCSTSAIVTQAPTKQEQQTVSPTQETTSEDVSCLDLELEFTTDSQVGGYTLVFLEGELGDIVFSQSLFLPDTTYEGNESLICLVPSKCYDVLLADEEGDGLESTGNFVLEVDGEIVMEVDSTDKGIPCPDCSSTGKLIYWSARVGNCSESDTSPDIPSDCDGPEVEIVFQTDTTPTEYVMMVFDFEDLNDNERIDDPLLVEGGFDMANGGYEMTVSCLDPLKCYGFAMLDNGLDGLGKGGALTVTFDGVDVFSLGEGDTEDLIVLDDGSTSIWLVLFGNCS